ncbi:Glucan endo-1,3-beta-glucosidase, acidic isoform [Apostasia shenzhenica]|uniref:Glucan endo-1,3-beta-glucosidase, acidic isoform n=1 Tax=Apostasia shenzhenica TaxID=1088818 RepID=A0A2I0ASP8_9ASPA|nr:Glucan endo-1,3-beta-glucosidase, acidic isoform [Apostasia shenzhenica]
MISMSASPSLLLFGLLLALPTGSSPPSPSLSHSHSRSLFMVKVIGVCYGVHGDNLPPPASVVQLYKSKNITAMRIYSPDTTTMQALKGSGLLVTVGVANEDIQRMATDSTAASTWVHTYITPFLPLYLLYVAVGHNVIPGELAGFVLPAMKNLQTALSAAGVKAKVSTAVSHDGLLGASFPPSAGHFLPEAEPFMTPIVQFLAANGSPLLVNLFPYYVHARNPAIISLDYALFTAPGPVVVDQGKIYDNLFDAMVDTMYWALEKAGAAGVRVVVSETGWPTAGGPAATVSNAQTYNTNLIEHAAQGTRKTPGGTEVYIFSMFNENQKAAAVEQNFGLFNPDETSVYPIDLRTLP